MKTADVLRAYVDEYPGDKPPYDEIREAADDLEALEAKLAKARETIEGFAQWADAYPLEVFPGPDLKEVGSILRACGRENQMDRMHAAWARDILKEAGKDAREALEAIDGK